MELIENEVTSSEQNSHKLVEEDINRRFHDGQNGEQENNSDRQGCNELEGLPVKTELVDVDGSCGGESPYREEDYINKNGEEGDSDGQILGELPVKTELVETDGACEDESSPREEDFDQFNIKVEPLEECYEDRINAFLHAMSNQGDKNTESDGEAGSTHFLATQYMQTSKPLAAGGGLRCGHCSAMFKYQSTYDYHVKSRCGTKVIAGSSRGIRKGKNKAFICNVCGKEVCSRTSLMVHMRLHNGERPFVCDICRRTFVQKAHLKDHMKLHLSGKTPRPLVHTCSECGQVFSDKKSLQEHITVHFGDKVFDCNVCHKRFRTRSNLSNHKIIHSDKKEFSCTICGKDFLRKLSLDDHMRVHTKEKPFSCVICGKRFAERSRCNIHMKRHTGELTQVCSVCDKRFANTYDLRVHQRKHTGERPFPCNICGRAFNRKAIMETHMTIHTGRKDFVCSQCGEAFNRKSKLEVHQASHSGERFHCEVCHRVFKCKAYLVPHVRTHLGQKKRKQRDKPLSCLLCCQAFPSTQALQAHLQESHPSLFETNSVVLQPHTVDIKVESLE